MLYAHRTQCRVKWRRLYLQMILLTDIIKRRLLLTPLRLKTHSNTHETELKLLQLQQQAGNRQISSEFCSGVWQRQKCLHSFHISPHHHLHLHHDPPVKHNTNKLSLWHTLTDNFHSTDPHLTQEIRNNLTATECTITYCYMYIYVCVYVYIYIYYPKSAPSVPPNWLLRFINWVSWTWTQLLSDLIFTWLAAAPERLTGLWFPGK